MLNGKQLKKRREKKEENASAASHRQPLRVNKNCQLINNKAHC
jgi:hypothetical protein